MNGKTGSPIYSSRGIGQGNSFSPYIFIICVQYLGRYIHFAAMRPNSNIGIKFNKDCPDISVFDVCLMIASLNGDMESG